MVGGKVDPANKGWWKRMEPVTLSINGSLAVNTIVDIKGADLAQTKNQLQEAVQVLRTDA